YGLTFFTPQFAGTRWDVTGELGRTRAGTFVHQEIAYPFVGEVSKWGGRQSFRRDDQFFDYIVNDDPSLRAHHVLLPLREKFFDMTVTRRIGERGNMALVGGGISFQELDYPGNVEIAPEGNFDEREPADSAAAAPVLRQTERLTSIRLALLLGYRSVEWVERRGFDSLRGEQDIRLGAETGLAFARSIPALEEDDDTYITVTLYTGLEAGPALFALRSRADVRRDLDAPAADAEWEDLYGEAELFAYWRPAPDSRHTALFRAAAAGAWNTRTPFQLTLGGERALRGYDVERFPGGRRIILTLEERFYLGWPFKDVFDTGITLFADAGRIWPGDAPFGMDSDWRASAGFGIRQNFPAGSRTTYRIDLAWPIEAGTGLGDFRLRLSIGEIIGLASSIGDLQFLRSRPEGAAGQLFQFRN
ncbi:MAG: BamA/TamA family outer membrane protein, partial [Longimicrobiales bacterium]